MNAQRLLFVDQFRGLDPQQPTDGASTAVEQLLRASLIYHLTLALLFGVLAAFLLYRRKWARLLLTTVLTLGLLGTAFSFVSPTPTPILYKSLNVVSWLLGVGALSLIWAPVAAREYFSSRRSPLSS